MADYNENELPRMRQEAIRRMQEMQRRAQGIFGNTGQPERGHEPEQPRENLNTDNTVGEQPRQGSKSLLGGLGSNGELFKLAGMPIDEEKALIGMLIYILYKQGADIKLLLALGYLLI